MRVYAPEAYVRRLGTAVVFDGSEMQRPDRELFDQHAPALTGHFHAADDAVERHEHVATRDRSVLERHVEWKVPPPDRHTGYAARNQRAGDAVIDLVAEELVRVEQTKREADDGRDGRERDVALGEVELEADDLAALAHSLANHAGVGE